MEKKSNPIIFAESFKGGVGKSMVAVTLAEYCKARNISVSIIDTDKTCPDVDAIYSGKTPCRCIDLGKVDGGGWIELFDFAETHHETIIVNMSAASKKSMTENKHIIANCLGLLKRPLNLFFALGIQRQSVDQLKAALALFPDANLVVAVKNLQNGDQDEFFNYDNAKSSGEFADVREIFLPKLHARLSLKVTDDGATISEMLEGDLLIDREKDMLKRWIEGIFSEYDGVEITANL